MRREDWNNGLNGLDVSLIENHLAEKDKYKKKRNRNGHLFLLIFYLILCYFLNSPFLYINDLGIV